MNENEIFGFEFLTAVAMNWTVFWAAMAHGSVRTKLSEGRANSKLNKQLSEIGGKLT
jgi:hypothetical protein